MNLIDAKIIMEFHKEQGWVSDGCTFAPDFIFGEDSCYLHDVLLVHTTLPRKACDRLFLEFMLEQSEARNSSYHIRYGIVAYVYYSGVRIWGYFK